MYDLDTIEKLVVADALLIAYEKTYLENKVLSGIERDRRDAIFCKIQDLVGSALRELEQKESN